MTKLSTIFLLIASGFSGIAEDYQKTRQDISSAIQDGNFTEVKGLLVQLMPELKQDLRQNKAFYHEVKKSLEPAELQELKLKIERKKEIYHSLEHLLNVTPAAIRARASSVVKLLDEYNRLEISA